MRRVGLIALFSALAGVVAPSASAQNLGAFSLSMPETARSAALGGPHAALVDDVVALFDNPAGFLKATPGITVSALSVDLQGPIFDIAGTFAQAASGESPTTLLSSPNVQNLLEGIYTGMKLAGPVYLTYVGNGLGFGIFDTSNVTIATTEPFTLGFGVSQQLLLEGGYSFRIPLPPSWNSTLDAGLLLKGSLQGTSLITESLVALPTFIQSLGSQSVLGQPYELISGIGVDAGLLYSWNDVLSVGIVGKDLYSPVLTSSYSSLQALVNGGSTPSETESVQPLNLSEGIMFSPRLGMLREYISSLKVMLDYNDSLAFLTHPATANNIVLNFGLGTEVDLLNALSLRAGFYQGLFAAGLGLNLYYFTLDASMFGTELTTQPGLEPVYNVMVDISFRI